MHLFSTAMDVHVPDVGADAMRQLDELAMGTFGMDLLQMMENAGRELAGAVQEILASDGGVTVLAGAGGNGGGGLAAARHLHGRNVPVRVILTRPHGPWTSAAARQRAILDAAGVPIAGPDEAEGWIADAAVTVDALIGYGLNGPPGGVAADLIRSANRFAKSIVSLDVPSGLDATDGTVAGPVVRPKRTLTLALPKTGLADPTADLSDLWLADIGIPPGAIVRLGFGDYVTPFRVRSRVSLRCSGSWAARCREAAGRGERRVPARQAHDGS